MATSGSVDFSKNKQQVINLAFAIINQYGEGRTVSSPDMDIASTVLNMMLKAWINKGLHLWTKEEGVLFCTKDVGTYTLGTSASYTSLWSDAVLTSLNGDHTSSDTTLTVDTTTGMTAADTIGIVLDDGTIHWTTIVSVDSSTTLTITSGIADDASDNANIYTYTTRITKPLKIHSIRVVQGIEDSAGASADEVNLQPLSHSQFMEIANKGNVGLTTSYYYNPDLSSTTLYLWPKPNSVNYYFRFTYSRHFEDMDSLSDDFDLPVEWLEAITWQLAIRLAPIFGKRSFLPELLPIASQMLDDMLDFDAETESIRFQPDVGC